jgi:hypothetical protein
MTKRLGSKGLLRADIVVRDWTDFYSSRTQVGDTYDLNGDGTPDGDVIEIGNFGNDFLERTYRGLEFQGRYRFTDDFTLAGNYTYSELEGNINGETSGSGPVPSSPNVYPEFNVPTSFTVGPLAADQAHKLRIWGIYDILAGERHSLSVSLLQNFFSGTPYSDAISVDTSAGSLTGDYIRATFPAANNYVQPSSTSTYFPSGRGSFTTEDTTRTDLSVSYSFNFSIAGKDVSLFLIPSIINVFDEDATDNPNSDTLDFTNSGLADFNAFTDTPVRGVNYDLGDEFGQADSFGDFQQPRTFQFSLGFRF